MVINADLWEATVIWQAPRSDLILIDHQYGKQNKSVCRGLVMQRAARKLLIFP